MFGGFFLAAAISVGSYFFNKKKKKAIAAVPRPVAPRRDPPAPPPPRPVIIRSPAPAPPRPIIITTPPPPPQIVRVVETKSEVDYVKLAENARAGGFNPLTALRNGGAAGFQVTSTPFLTSNPAFTAWQNNYQSVSNYQQQLYGYRQNEYQRQADNELRDITDNYNYQNRLSESVYTNSLDFYNGEVNNYNSRVSSISDKYDNISQLVSGLGSAFGGLATFRQNRQRFGLESQLMQSEINRNNRSFREILQPTEKLHSGNETVTLKGRFEVQKPDFVDPLTVRMSPEAGRITLTNPWTDFNINPNHLDAETFEQRYGDVAQELAGVKNAIADTYHNISDYFTGGAFNSYDVSGYNRAVADNKARRRLNYQSQNYWANQRASQ